MLATENTLQRKKRKKYPFMESQDIKSKTLRDLVYQDFLFNGSKSS